jgi:hypothetical protein
MIAIPSPPLDNRTWLGVRAALPVEACPECVSYDALRSTCPLCHGTGTRQPWVVGWVAIEAYGDFHLIGDTTYDCDAHYLDEFIGFIVERFTASTLPPELMAGEGREWGLRKVYDAEGGS